MLAAGVGLALVAVATSGGAPDDAKPGKGMLLVAKRQIKDPHFSKTVVLLFDRSPRGVRGLIINRDTEIKPADVLEQIDGLKKHRQSLFEGGPVQRDHFFLLIDTDKPPSEAHRIIDGVYLGESKELVEELCSRKKTRESFRLYSGFAGWSPGQREAEIARGDWLVVPADRERIFTEDPLALWKRLIPPSPQDLARLAAPAVRRSDGNV
jgi:putative transcriptional regulator